MKGNKLSHKDGKAFLTLFDKVEERLSYIAKKIMTSRGNYDETDGLVDFDIEGIPSNPNQIIRMKFVETGKSGNIAEFWEEFPVDVLWSDDWEDTFFEGRERIYAN